MLMPLKIITLKTIKVITPAPKSRHLISSQDKMNNRIGQVGKSIENVYCVFDYITPHTILKWRV